jgi:hypothetical protein
MSEPVSKPTHLPPSPAQQQQVPFVTQSWEMPQRRPYRPDALFITGVPSPLMVEEERRRNSQAQYQEILNRIASLEETMVEIRQALRAPGIGHNGPPEPIPFDDSDSQAIELAVAVLKSQQATPQPAAAIQAAITLKTITRKIGAYVAKQADIFATEVAKSTGSESGKWLVRGPLLYLLMERLDAVVKAVSDWIVSLGGRPF